VTLVVLAHGSANPTGVRTVEAVVSRVRYRLPGVPVRAAYVEVGTPSLARVLAEVEDDVVVVPLLCAQDHALVAGTGSPHGSLVADTLGPERLLAQVAVQRLRAAGARSGQPVLMVVGGSKDPSAQGRTARAAGLLEEAWSGPVRAAHLTGHGQRMSEVVSDLRARDAAVPAVAPYFVAPGRLHDRTRAGARTLGLEVVADVLGDHPYVAEAVARRYRAATARRFAESLGRPAGSPLRSPAAAAPSR
jgi:sirohydrochlorin ferrochelatase